MGYIPEPEGVILYVENRPLTTEEESMIQDFIRDPKRNTKRRIKELLNQKNYTTLSM